MSQLTQTSIIELSSSDQVPSMAWKCPPSRWCWTESWVTWSYKSSLHEFLSLHSPSCAQELTNLKWWLCDVGLCDAPRSHNHQFKFVSSWGQLGECSELVQTRFVSDAGTLHTSAGWGWAHRQGPNGRADSLSLRKPGGASSPGERGNPWKALALSTAHTPGPYIASSIEPLLLSLQKYVQFSLGWRVTISGLHVLSPWAFRGFISFHSGFFQLHFLSWLCI